MDSALKLHKIANMLMVKMNSENWHLTIFHQRLLKHLIHTDLKKSKEIQENDQGSTKRKIIGILKIKEATRNKEITDNIEIIEIIESIEIIDSLEITDMLMNVNEVGIERISIEIEKTVEI